MRHLLSEQQVSSDAPVVATAPDPFTARFQELDMLQRRSTELELRLADLNVKTSQLREQRDQASPADRPRLDKQYADAQHDMTAAAIELSAAHEKIGRLDRMLQAQAPTPMTVQPMPMPMDPFLGREQIMQIGAGVFLLMFPLVLALARRLWVRSGRAPAVSDLESSPRLQRMEEAIESIAVEVERIGEAQRFATKLLTERQPVAEANRVAPAAMPVARREPGTITPH